MIYDGRANIVTVWKNGIKMTLKPKPKEQADGKQGESNFWEKRVLMCSAKEFLAKEEKQSGCYANIPKGPYVEKATVEEKIPVEVGKNAWRVSQHSS